MVLFMGGRKYLSDSESATSAVMKRQQFAVGMADRNGDVMRVTQESEISNFPH
jgi:hypothetical protein